MEDFKLFQQVRALQQLYWHCLWVAQIPVPVKSSVNLSTMEMKFMTCIFIFKKFMEIQNKYAFTYRITCPSLFLNVKGDLRWLSSMTNQQFQESILN